MIFSSSKSSRGISRSPGIILLLIRVLFSKKRRTLNETLENEGLWGSEIAENEQPRHVQGPFSLFLSLCERTFK